MKHLFKTLLLSAAALIAVTSCSDEEEKTIEKAIQSVIQKKIVVDTMIATSTNSYEFGHKLFFSRDGSITALGCRMPTANKPYRVSLWDFDSEDLIAAVTITPTDSAAFTYVNIAAVPVTANKRYIISINNTSGGVEQKYFAATKKSNVGNASIYPFSEGSSTFEGLYIEASTTSTFPEDLSFQQFLIGGYPDCVFEY